MEYHLQNGERVPVPDLVVVYGQAAAYAAAAPGARADILSSLQAVEAARHERIAAGEELSVTVTTSEG